MREKMGRVEARNLAAVVLACLLIVGLQVSGLPTVLGIGQAAKHGGDLVIYDDRLASDWQDKVWGAYIDLDSKAQKHSGGRSVSVDLKANGAWSPGASSPIDTAGYGGIRFHIHGGEASDQNLVVMVSSDWGENWKTAAPVSNFIAGGKVQAGEWRQVEIPFSALGAENTPINRFAIHDYSGSDYPIFYVDDVVFYAKSEPAPEPTATPVPQTPTEVPATDTPVAPGEPVVEPTATAVAPIASPEAPAPQPTQDTSTGTGMTLYDDQLHGGWVSKEWSASADVASTAQKYAGNSSVAITVQKWGAWSPGTSSPVDGTKFDGLRFQIHGGATGGQRLVVMASSDWGVTWLPRADVNQYVAGGSIAANEWRTVEIPLAALGVNNASINRIAIHDNSGGPQATFYVDNVEFFGGSYSISLPGAPAPTPVAPAPTATPVAPAPTPVPPAATPSTPPANTSDLFKRTDLIYGSEIGGWSWNGSMDGHPVIANATAQQLSRDAKISVYRWLPGSKFTDMGGSMTTAQFNNVIDSIINKLNAVPFIKLPPGKPSQFEASQLIDVAWYKEIIRRAGSRVTLYEFMNEPNYYGEWTGSQYTAEWNKVVPELKQYARSLGFEIQIGGPVWAWQNSSEMSKFMQGVKAEYDRTGNKDLIPAFISWHEYPAWKTTHTNDEIMAKIPLIGQYIDQMKAESRRVFGYELPMAITEWNYNSNFDPRFQTDPGFMDRFTKAILTEFRQHGLWMANQFAFSSDAGSGALDLVNIHTMEPNQMYYSFKDYSSVNR